jgi:hypothetical protein
MLGALNSIIVQVFGPPPGPELGPFASLSDEELERMSKSEAMQRLWAGIATTEEAEALRPTYIAIDEERTRRRKARAAELQAMSDEQLSSEDRKDWMVQSERKRRQDDEEVKRKMAELRATSDAKLTGELARFDVLLSGELSDKNRKTIAYRIRSVTEELERRSDEKKLAERRRDKVRTYAAVFATGAAVGGLLVTVLSKVIG